MGRRFARGGGPAQIVGRTRAVPAVAGQAARMSAALKVEKQVQEQTQIIATAIGMPTTKAPTIINVNSESKFVPGRAFPTNMPISPPLTSN
jgi:hypothetical protein